MNKKIAFATYAKLGETGPDDQPAADALQDMGYTVEAAVWNAQDVEWGQYQAVVIRSCWDYHLHPTQFIEWLQQLEKLSISVLNPPNVLRWNMDKSYLLDMADWGIRVTPTVRLPKSAKVELGDVLATKGWEQAVVKPLISASAHQTWVSDGAVDEDQGKLEAMLAQEAVLVQPFVPEIQTQGELSLLFFDKQYSHTVLKRPQNGDFRVQAEYGGSTELIQPGEALIAQAQQIVDMIEAPLAYTRVDAVEVDGQLMLMELELIEPYLFLREDPHAAQRFATAIHKQISNQIS
ncbi:MAG: hypothetical protein DWQ07_19820 [Chloroflexi bacterium]|nr:MAG: hypothetical protein DWQ07_19820 [Chloroflexota bacterium]MBL1194332.1 hypothetical protein [Chloroflexota bacterium]NOH11622.1 hypothetical protein [Chloroflexota bacterium]